MFKKFMFIFFSVALVVMLGACGSDSSKNEGVDYGSTLSVQEADASPTDVLVNDVLVYYPKPNAAETLGVKTTGTAPIFLVFGNGAYTQGDAVAYAQSSGLAKIAAENGSSVCFVNPQNGASWEAADATAYATVAQIVKDDSGAEVINGVAHSISPIPPNLEETGISGTASRIYVYAIGSGADFIAANALKTVTVPTFWGGTVDVTMSGCTLTAATDVSGVPANDIPVVAIGCSYTVNTALEAKCGSLLRTDTADYISQFNSVIRNHRRQYGKLLPFYYYTEMGIVQQIGSTMVTTTADNVTFAGIATHAVNFVAYWDENLNVNLGNVPLVLCFHGGSGTALAEAQLTEWPLIAQENGFITVSVDLHYPNCTPGEIVQLIDFLKTQYSIDEKKIYASGFSMGGAKSWDLFEQYPEVFAALSPHDASFAPGIDSFNNPVSSVNTDTVVPVFYVGGEISPLPELPYQPTAATPPAFNPVMQRLVDRVGNVFDVNDVTQLYSIDPANHASWVNSIWGLDPEVDYAVTDHINFTDSTLTVNLYVSNDGKYYTAMANASNQNHEVYARNSWAAWDFMKQFSRNADGSISISAVTYSLPSDGNTIIDNSYNL